MLEFNRESLDKCLYNYKYGKINLENTIKLLLDIMQLESACLYNKTDEDLATELAEYLTKYKFNEFIYGYENFIHELVKFLNLNKEKFGLKYSYTKEFRLDDN